MLVLKFDACLISYTSHSQPISLVKEQARLFERGGRKSFKFWLAKMAKSTPRGPRGARKAPVSKEIFSPSLLNKTLVSNNQQFL